MHTNPFRFIPTRTLLGTTLALALTALAALPGSAAAQDLDQFRVSQWASVSQQLARTLVTVDYSRPIARGRSPLFGGVVHWGEIWTPGANDATILELSADAKVEGHEIPAGRWSMWMVPSDVGAWELILDPRDTLFHTQRPEIGAEGQIRFEIRTEPVEHVEVLTWSFPRVDHNVATLRMAWGETSVPLEIEADAALPETVVSEEAAARYAGEWRVTFTMAPPGQPKPPPVTLDVWHGEDGSLMGQFPAGAFGPPPEGPASGEEEGDEGPMTARERERAEARKALAEQSAGEFTFMLVPYAEGIFRLGFLSPEGRLLDVENFFFEFQTGGAGPARLDLRGPEDRVVATGEREGG